MRGLLFIACLFLSSAFGGVGAADAIVDAYNFTPSVLPPKFTKKTIPYTAENHIPCASKSSTEAVVSSRKTQNNIRYEAKLLPLRDVRTDLNFSQLPEKPAAKVTSHIYRLTHKKKNFDSTNPSFLSRVQAFDFVSDDHAATVNAASRFGSQDHLGIIIAEADLSKKQSKSDVDVQVVSAGTNDSNNVVSTGNVISTGNIVSPANAWPTNNAKSTAGGSKVLGSKNLQQSMIALVLALALITSLASGIGWFATQQILAVRARKSDPYQIILRREVTDLARPDAQMCRELCRTGQNLISEINSRAEEIRDAAPLRRVLLREVKSMDQFFVMTIRTSPEDPREWRRMRLRLQRVVTDLIRLKDITDSARRSLKSRVISDELPRDKSEAYEVLGANPEASERILKRLVDALRATWHPDLATNEQDRSEREQRIKQINVAWDLITGKRGEV